MQGPQKAQEDQQTITPETGDALGKWVFRMDYSPPLLLIFSVAEKLLQHQIHDPRVGQPGQTTLGLI